MTTRWGILGTGGIAATFASDLALVPGAALAAVGSRSPEPAAAFATRHGFARSHGSWAALAADPDVDVIYVATPHAFHREAAMTCLAGGKAVLCEKPLTLDLATSEQLVQEARARGLFLMEAMWMRCNPAIRKALALVRDGAIGDVVTIHADLGLRGPFAATHRLRDPALGGGALLDLGVYLAHLTHLFLGNPSTTQSWARLTPEGVDETTGMLLGYDPAAVAALTCSISGASRNAASITGTRGRIDLPEGFYAPRSFILHRDDTETFGFPFEGNGFQYEAIEVQRCLAEGLLESPLVPHAATLEVMTLLDAVRAEIGVVYGS
ncbi:Gfo/Idh/MocA family protein [Couchioplanes caeruleus]|uniref:Oxidoreductase n=2 Tax=Couchioplanes caeruleus TaxID=56438 RepID=A0A1K0FB03_9ACTN|nr:Gfo/Idh/MocA family oxidoreductase [Couchioplanes caeruleus]OJF10037.1 oxidoreductase [Couchioplanes caeruleus subsp. caeruleus]ROP31664.1 putative dehydrogenase [Couchioplanes caeruleus]